MPCQAPLHEFLHHSVWKKQVRSDFAPTGMLKSLESVNIIHQKYNSENESHSKHYNDWAFFLEKPGAKSILYTYTLKPQLKQGNHKEE